MKCIIVCIFLLNLYLNLNAQFNTIQKESTQGYIIIEKKSKAIESEIICQNNDSVYSGKNQESQTHLAEYRLARKRPPRTKVESKPKYSVEKTSRLEGLSILALYREIIENDIKHPKIVLAQAILETGWFQSSVCRNKGNLFGLTNPRTGKYYEFNNWKESVKAYRDKVQYKYKEGNYLLWLREIGYAEDPRYISSLIKLLEQYFI